MSVTKRPAATAVVPPIKAGFSPEKRGNAERITTELNGRARFLHQNEMHKSDWHDSDADSMAFQPPAVHTETALLTQSVSRSPRLVFGGRSMDVTFDLGSQDRGDKWRACLPSRLTDALEAHR